MCGSHYGSDFTGVFIHSHSTQCNVWKLKQRAASLHNESSDQQFPIWVYLRSTIFLTKRNNFHRNVNIFQWKYFSPNSCSILHKIETICLFVMSCNSTRIIKFLTEMYLEFETRLRKSKFIPVTQYVLLYFSFHVERESYMYTMNLHNKSNLFIYFSLIFLFSVKRVK